mmetsp:Transcript_43368/g.135840  ORF Transcript_43368/g.135840 Transcript_43368/m.135840 type:complete len:349 (-) Transcript_43368:168-1214(-)
MLVSLGTSDTLLAPVARSNLSPEPQRGGGGDAATPGDDLLVGHCFPSPIEPKPAAFLMLCYKNGGTLRANLAQQLLAHRRGRGAAGHDPWRCFSEVAGAAFEDAAAGKDVEFRVVLDMPEITPVIERPGQYGCRFTAAGPRPLWFGGRGGGGGEAEAEALVRGHVLSRFLSMYTRMRRLRPDDAPPSPRDAILVGGGGARSDGMLQVLADVFGCAVIRTETSDFAAALGAALRAKHGCMCGDGFVPFKDAIDNASLARLQGFTLSEEAEAAGGGRVFRPRAQYRDAAKFLATNYEAFERDIGRFYLNGRDSSGADEGFDLDWGVDIDGAHLGAAAATVALGAFFALRR